MFTLKGKVLGLLITQTSKRGKSMLSGMIKEWVIHFNDFFFLVKEKKSFHFHNRKGFLNCTRSMPIPVESPKYTETAL